MLLLQLTPGGKWWQSPPPTIVFPMTIVAQVRARRRRGRGRHRSRLLLSCSDHLADPTQPSRLQCIVLHHYCYMLQCKGFGSKCIVDMNGAPNPLFLIHANAGFSGGWVGGWGAVGRAGEGGV